LINSIKLLFLNKYNKKKYHLINSKNNFKLSQLPQVCKKLSTVEVAVKAVPINPSQLLF